ncbi:MAG: hypothetical protein H7836_15480 [Magnetococcus sp. YQC-3]
MKEIKVELVGTTDLLMNSPAGMLEPTKEIKSKLDKYNPKIEAEKVAYKNSAGKLYVPSTAVKGAMINASSFKKAGKYALRPIIAGGVRVKETELILNKQSYEIDLRTVVIQRARVVKARPRISDWKLNFSLIYNEDMISNPDIIKEVLNEAGIRVGLLDFRPQKTGEFGCFKVGKFEVVGNAK